MIVPDSDVRPLSSSTGGDRERVTGEAGKVVLIGAAGDHMHAMRSCWAQSTARLRELEGTVNGSLRHRIRIVGEPRGWSAQGLYKAAVGIGPGWFWPAA